MFRHCTYLCTLLLSALVTHASLAQTTDPKPDAAPDVGFAIVKTSQVAVPQALLVPGGSITKQGNSNFSAFLVKHHNDYLLFDTGMGSQIDSQYQQGMPIWWRLFFKYDKPVVTARTQLDNAGIPPLQRVILSHSHWDHAGGAQDFPEARVGVAAAELELVRSPSTGPGGTWQSQTSAATIQWEPLVFQPIPFKGYPESLDVFKDGKVVLVPMPSHTPGSVGLFVTVDSGKQYFFIGDVAWTVAALQQGKPKFWVAGKLVDSNPQQTQSSIEKVRALMQSEPDLVVVPAHDSTVQDSLGYFPAWVR
ncbi:MBL fold metallo-hydrolase [Comamonas testosteroni]|uniref:MBL fold metallo-hydrolase n=1 Tax=Comamonas testosteroni TaxID=285 RepID=A0A5A7ML91_COMTE|nr:MBL fold metallo-hydrolase [Comamonas testosteroni]GEQ77701.1 MBL fold metallo-hydrolase [Comamonas testosteroni]